MKLDLYEIGFVILLMTALYLFLKFAFFKPVTQVMDEREAAIAAGGAAKAEAAAQVEQRQSEYASRLRELRGKAFDQRKSLAAAASMERTALLDKAREESSQTRKAALEELKTKTASAKVELVAQVDALSESMVQHLLKQA
jgi:F-type H+-transporting ATPase subunit b